MIYEFEDFGNLELVNFTSLDNSSSAEILAMRNHPDIRRWMHNKDIITASQHQSFINSLKSSSSKQYFALFNGDSILGTLNFVDIKDFSSSFGLYANPQLDRAGIGKAIMHVATYYARDVLHLKILHLHVLENNHRAIVFYEKCGFKENGDGQVEGDPVLFFKKEL